MAFLSKTLELTYSQVYKWAWDKRMEEDKLFFSKFAEIYDKMIPVAIEKEENP